MTLRKSIRDDGKRTPPDESDAFYAARRTAWEQKVGHTIAHECQFIDGLGSWWSPPARTRRPSRAYLLEKYLITLDQRRGFTETERAVLRARVLVHLERGT